MAGLGFERETDALLRRLCGKCVVVTGAGGFIGFAALSVLAPYAAELRALLGAPGDPVWKPPIHIQTHLADIRDRVKLLELMRGADVVVHAAGPPSVRTSFREPGECAAVHVLGTIAVMEACRTAQVQRVVYISSAEVYGQPDFRPVWEECAIRPLSPYGAAKAAAEVFVRTMAQQANIECCVLRLFSVFGPRQSPCSVIATILSQSGRAEGLWLNDLKPIRDYCYVQDVAEAIALACVAGVKDCTCNIGSGQGTSVEQLAELILSLQAKQVPIRQKASGERPQGTEIYELVADVGRAASILGWQPRTPLAAGLRETIAWTQQRGS